MDMKKNPPFQKKKRDPEKGMDTKKDPPFQKKKRDPEFTAPFKKLKSAWIHNNPQGFSESDATEFKGIVWDICTRVSDPRPGDMYDAYKDFLEEYLWVRFVWPLTKKSTMEVLRKLPSLWDLYKKRVTVLHQLFGPLERLPKVPDSLADTEHKVFVDNILKIDGLKLFVLSMVEQAREGVMVDRKLLKDVCEVMVGKEINAFHKAMLDETNAYYSSKASSLIQQDFHDYLQNAERSLSCDDFLFSNKMSLIEIGQTKLLLTQSSKIFEDKNYGFVASLQQNLREHLLRMYSLYSYQQDFPEIAAPMFKMHMTDACTSVFEQAQVCLLDNEGETRGVVGVQKQVIVKNLIQLHDKYMTYVKECFQNHIHFHKALKEVFEVFCNKDVDGSSFAELLASFCDNTLKKGGSGKSSDDVVEEMLEQAVSLVAHIRDKDLFAKFYWKKSARRLLFHKSVHDDHERCILTKLKKQLNREYISKIEIMVADLILARDHKTYFKEYLNLNTELHPGIDMSVTVLNTGSWPSFKISDLNLPSVMVKCVKVFQDFYQTKAKNRKLTWIYSLGTCKVIGYFESKAIELVVSTYQASLLLLFNASDRLSYSEIMSQLNLTDDDVVRLLHSLSCAKYKILTKDPNNGSISPTDTFEFNSMFRHQMRSIEIPLPSVNEKKKVIEDVDKDRRYEIDASVVRIMKSRKVFGHQQLVKECVEQLGRMFKPDVVAIKARIEDLIGREYLERDKEDPNVYIYLA